ncbi:RDD family protein [Halobacterium jilantaiense]|uniref:Uncharacterized membrane protein YckC, RDD family n=1 Tax=Halobacterium jilantaiense TaxID=355548 RepID=A0A1I0QMP4_9EURY|nr:RDD family protein [Halobacterium jilantaiense]SEW28637.1 Uncharacterized membrane protein YckC, RDD family [Halobacterium jilantaiense]
MSGATRLGLFGVIHMDDVEKVTAELDSFTGDADALFLEYPREPTDMWTWAAAALRLPAFVVGALFVQLFVQGPLFVLLTRDLFPSEFVATSRVADRLNLAVHRVDEHPVQGASSAGWTVVLLNWLLVLPVALFEPPAVAVTFVGIALASLVPGLVRRADYRLSALVLFVLGLLGFTALLLHGSASYLLLVVGAVGFGHYVRTGIGHRNDVMLDRVAAIADDEAYEEAVLVTGKGHLAGLARNATSHAFTVSRVHVSYWRDDGETLVSFAPDELPELASDGPAFRRRLRTLFSALRTQRRRIVAAVVDGAILAVLWFAAVVVGYLLFEPAGYAVMGIAAYVVPMSYHAVLERIWGRTLGKRLLGLVVTDTDGSSLSTRQAVLRNAGRPVGLVVGYVFGGTVMLNTARNQTPGDLLAGTVVGRPEALRPPDGEEATPSRVDSGRTPAAASR